MNRNAPLRVVAASPGAVCSTKKSSFEDPRIQKGSVNTFVDDNTKCNYASTTIKPKGLRLCD